MNGLPVHLANVPGVVSPITAEENSSGDEQSWRDEDTLESLPSSPSDDIHMLTEQATRLLDAYVYRDPVIDLTQVYRQKGVQDIDVYFQERRRQEDNGRFWGYTFECPLRGTFYHSSLPLPLFMSKPPLDLLVQLCHKVLGSYEIFDDGVFFYSRKHAKRSVALAALEALATSGTEGIMYPSPQEASVRLSQLSSVTPIITKTKHFSNWVHELCRLGVTSKTLKITYQEQLIDRGWNCNMPTMLSCVLSIEKPISVTAVGLPCPSKQGALDSAVALLTEEVNRQLPGFAQDFTQSPTNKELEEVQSCDPVDGIYVFPLPHWASDSMSKQGRDNNDDAADAPCLYEIEFISRESSGFDSVVLGIVFPFDPAPPESDRAPVVETEFDIVSGEQETEKIIAKLQKCRTLDHSDLPPNELEKRVQWTENFNRVILHRDVGKKTKDIESHGSDFAVVPSDRSYRFVPLVHSAFHAKSSTRIDWNALEQLCEEKECVSAATVSVSSTLSRLRDLIIFSMGVVYLLVPSVPIALYKYARGTDTMANVSWKHALVSVLLTLVLYIVFFHSRSKHFKLSPRQLLMMKHAKTYMPILEREIEAAHFASHLCCMASQIRAEKYSGNASQKSYKCSSTLPSSMNEATSLIPKLTYQRLEFLGDSVLGFFLGINLMGMNASLRWDSDELGRILSAAANNRVLREAALSCGLTRLLLCHHQESQITYAPANKAKKSSKYQSGVVRSLLSVNGQRTGLIHDHVLSDVVESLLGVAYLDGKSSTHDATGGRMAIALLEQFRLPFPEQDTESGLPFFQAAGPCLKTGYAFNHDKAWRRQLVQIGTTLYCEHEVINRLETGWLKLMGDLYSVSSNDGHRILMEKQKSKILLLCSLFNDNLSKYSDSESFRRMDSSFSSTSASTLDSDASSGDEDSTNTAENGLIRIALLRDTLFMVGHSSLHLAIADELFRRYPEASEGALSLQRSCATSDDTLAYIMVKNGFHKSLYNQNARGEKRFVSEMSAADSIGEKIWKRRNGWILKGGESEFAKRRSTLSFSMPDGPPRYCGLAGGRLYGHKFSKLPDSVTEDLVFSLKAIAGALVLSLGLEGMWQSLGPLFGELLLLSADELRKEYRKVSSICK